MLRSRLNFPSLTRSSTLFHATRASSSSTTANARPSATNEDIIELLRKNVADEGALPEPHPYKQLAFIKAIKAIEDLDYPVASLKSADARRTIIKAKIIDGVGDGIAQRIATYLHDGEESSLGSDASNSNVSSPLQITSVRDPSLSSSFDGLSSEDDAKRAEEEARQRVIASLQVVPGIGRKMATDLVNEGCRNLDDLQDPYYRDLLPPTVKIGVDYFRHISQYVTIEQADLVSALIRDILESKFEIHPAGAYRRSLPTSPTLPLLFLHPYYNPPLALPAETPFAPKYKGRRPGRVGSPFIKTKSSDTRMHASLMWRRILTPLAREGVVVGAMSQSIERAVVVVRLPGEGEGREERVRGVSEREGVFRKAELHLAPFKSRIPALVALTGDGEFIKDLQIRARSQLMHLSEYGLWRWVWSFSPSSSSNSTATTTSQPSEEIDSDSITDELDEGVWEWVDVKREDELLEKLGMAWVEPSKRNFEFIMGPGRGSKGKRSGKRSGEGRRSRKVD
ncbi:hypothetical protein OE88DRAFT_1644046 [Heliocybe sulcata]|uniref:DNA-directed DNA polymerase X domain-containing protein n=1 Tax=Heliocybe sulcata TaxID=5364 RepID=A0A5C3N5L9_9AGAM|nr:hypothetical protein OE88DRAFT_1644046 [Heliocybe sulcata]